jgi:hypothetical protein
MTNSPDEEAHIAFLKRQRAREAEIKRLEAKNERLKQSTAVLRAANRMVWLRAEAQTAKAKGVRARTDRRIGRYTVDILVLGLLAAAWWFWLVDDLVKAGRG